MSKIDHIIIEEFFIRLYFNLSDKYYKAGAKRAYLDFNRTLSLNGASQQKRNEDKLDAEDYLISELMQLIETELNNQTEFDKKHRQICESLVQRWPALTIGQSQKWINMTLKYWLAFGENRIKNIEKNYIYFHIPIDSFVINDMLKVKLKSNLPWSKIDKYEDYFSYQENFREINIDKIPIVEELIFFNSTVPN